jgi:hypothetical protein
MSNSYVVLVELEERRVGSNLGHRPKFSWRILIGSHSRTPPSCCHIRSFTLIRCRSGFTTLPTVLLQSSPMWFLVGEGLGLSSSSYGDGTVDTRIYVVQATEA